MTTRPDWFALEVMHRKEENVASSLSRKEYECYVPVYESRRAWSDRIKVTTVPLFSGYVFCRFDLSKRRLPILTTPGVRQFVCVGGVPAPIPENEIEAIRTALRSGIPLEPCDRLGEGDRVIVKKGPFEGVEGAFLRYQGRDRLILSVSLIQRSISVEIDRALVEPVPVRLAHQRPSQWNSQVKVTA